MERIIIAPGFIKVISNQLVSGHNCTVRGDGNIIEGTFLNVIGNSNKVFGCHVCVTGHYNVVNGDFAQVKGKDNVVVGENGKATGTATINGERVGGITTTTARQPDKITPFPKRIIEAITEIVELRRQYSFDKENKVRGIKCPRQAEMVVDNVASATEESCLICMENKKCVLALPCSHVISCVACSREYLEKSQGHATCPKCRTVVSELKLIYL